MPVYRIHHHTRYAYQEPVSVCHNLAHLLPRESPRHFWTAADIDISPAPSIRAERRDYFGNRLTFFAVQEPHRRLDVTSTAQVELYPEVPRPQTHASWETARERLAAAASGIAPSAELIDAIQFTFPSAYVQLTPAVMHYAGPSFPAGRPLLDAVLDLTARIHKDFRYDTKSTTISTPLPEILATRAGVCQDFAHLQIACLRSMGLAARYVSGYLLTAPPPGKPRLIGADASHAWVAAYLPEEGWIDLDPTNNVIPSDKHLTLAWGRDFGDVSPLRGVILGGGKHKIDVSVDVTPLI
jgi:transglutaminase-like putative cysteine protease